MQKSRLRVPLGFAALALLLFFAAWANMNAGAVHVGLADVLRIVFLRDFEGTAAYSVLWKIRLPRMAAAALLGGALSVSGFLLQTFFRNPIAGPYVLGVSSGSKLFVCLVMVASLGQGVALPFSATIAAAFVGSMLCMGLVLLFAGRVRSMSMLLLIGVMIGNICAAITDFLVTFAAESDVVNLHAWSMGSFSGAGFGSLSAVAPVIALALLAVCLLVKPISAYQLGEDYAMSMGVNVRAFRAALIVLSSLLSACVTALAGPISFVGVAVPHMAKLLFGTSRPQVILPGAFLLGSVFCMLCDLLARTLFSPAELAVSTVTAVFGAPMVIALMLRRERGEA